MTIGVVLTEKDKEVLKELEQLHNKIVNSIIFDCTNIDCDDCPFHHNVHDTNCTIENLGDALEAVLKPKERK